MSRSNKNSPSLIEYHGSAKVLDLLESLTQTPAGNVLYQQIEHILRENDHTQDRIIRGYTALVLTLIESYRYKLPKDSLLYLELKLIQKRLTPPITIAELATLQNYIKKASRLITELTDLDDELIRETLAPLLGITGATEHRLFADAPEEPQTNISAEQHVDSVYRKKLDEQHRKMGQLQKQVASKINEASLQYEEFKILLNSVYDDLQQTDDKQELRELRQKTVLGVSRLMDKQTNFSHILDEAKQLLDKVNNNSQQLSKELDQVRVLSLTDDLTHLPNRRAFVRRLGDEIHRSQRENSPLMLGLLDLDHFKNINDKYGHNVGDEILQCYARDILSIFRHYDMVARYGGEEFAVILPNTDYEGAMRAFNKVKNKAAGHYYRHQDTSLALPSFSAGLSMHHPGESSKEFIGRVDALLYKAKQAGRNHIEFDKPPTEQKQAWEESVSD